MPLTLRRFALLGSAAALFMPQVALAGFFDFFGFTPAPPIYDRPFAVGTAGATVQIDLRIKEACGWHFILTFTLNNDTERERVFKLLGHGVYADGSYDKKEPGIETPVLVEIERLDAGETQADDIPMMKVFHQINMVDARPVHPGAVYVREVHPHGVVGYGQAFFERSVGFIMFKPGTYRVYVTALKDIPEIQSLKTTFSIMGLAK